MRSMNRIQKTAVMPHSVEQMFTLVNDIEAYPDFLPWCNDAAVLSEQGNEVKASLTLAKGKLERSFTTINTLTPHSRMVMELLDGPFKHLKGVWDFEPQAEGGCRVLLDLEFEFSNKIIAMMFGPFFQQAATMLVDAFVSRAKEVYG